MQSISAKRQQCAHVTNAISPAAHVIIVMRVYALRERGICRRRYIQGVSYRPPTKYVTLHLVKIGVGKCRAEMPRRQYFTRYKRSREKKKKQDLPRTMLWTADNKLLFSPVTFKRILLEQNFNLEFSSVKMRYVKSWKVAVNNDLFRRDSSERFDSAFHEVFNNATCLEGRTK